MAVRALFLRWRSWLAPMLVVLAGFVLRGAYYNGDYGHPDEVITTEVVKHMRLSGDWDTNWAKADLEPGLAYDQYNFSSQLEATYFFYRAVKLVPGLERWRSAYDGRWVYRFFSVLLATVAVAQTWWLARRAGGERAAGLAGALVVVVPLLVQDAHYMRPEAFVTALTLAAVALAWPEAGWRPGRVFASAVVVGFLIACKISMLALGWVPLVTALLQPAPDGRRWGRLAGAVGLTLLGIAAGFALGAPGALAHPRVFWHGVEYLTKQYAGLHPPHSHVDGGAVTGMLFGYFWSTLGGGAVVAGLVGAGILLVRRQWAVVALVLLPVVLFAGYFATRSVFFERNLSHVVPLFCVLAGLGAGAIADGIVRRWRWPMAAVTVVLGCGLILRPAELSRRLVWLDFSMRAVERHEDYESKLRARFAAEDWWIEAFMSDEPVQRLEAHFRKGGGPVAVRVIDYNDEWSARYGPQFPARLDVELIGDYPSEYADVPGCTLHTYNSWHDRYYLVRGVKKP